jgi:hypothetical protein
MNRPRVMNQERVLYDAVYHNYLPVQIQDAVLARATCHGLYTKGTSEQ